METATVKASSGEAARASRAVLVLRGIGWVVYGLLAILGAVWLLNWPADSSGSEPRWHWWAALTVLATAVGGKLASRRARRFHRHSRWVKPVMLRVLVLTMTALFVVLGSWQHDHAIALQRQRIDVDFVRTAALHRQAQQQAQRLGLPAGLTESARYDGHVCMVEDPLPFTVSCWTSTQTPVDLAGDISAALQTDGLPAGTHPWICLPQSLCSITRPFDGETLTVMVMPATAASGPTSGSQVQIQLLPSTSDFDNKSPANPTPSSTAKRSTPPR